ncbi:hypothetical protein BJ085DRAFT_39612 [Dimargaris cristalligena]|uniref:DUF7905 domain-containing protein n=1 Tax=Dimargaris cristalligena TaxID=215637 RepID=A0A4P9ZRP3_9FUNG|nr:hypothetical protein BJ085DRAFT_39612 [Dimargaris cristalligena]|eukprot:RKP36216.1 hypothetical protein BJ085DRAFT_39612 [Dimargaris cristalligena]
MPPIRTQAARWSPVLQDVFDPIDWTPPKTVSLSTPNPFGTTPTPLFNSAPPIPNSYPTPPRESHTPWLKTSPTAPVRPSLAPYNLSAVYSSLGKDPPGPVIQKHVLTPPRPPPLTAPPANGPATPGIHRIYWMPPPNCHFYQLSGPRYHRLREIQAASGVKLWYDASDRHVRIEGTAKGAKLARKMLANLVISQIPKTAVENGLTRKVQPQPQPCPQPLAKQPRTGMVYSGSIQANLPLPLRQGDVELLWGPNNGVHAQVIAKQYQCHIAIDPQQGTLQLSTTDKTGIHRAFTRIQQLQAVGTYLLNPDENRLCLLDPPAVPIDLEFVRPDYVIRAYPHRRAEVDNPELRILRPVAEPDIYISECNNTPDQRVANIIANNKAALYEALTSGLEQIRAFHGQVSLKLWFGQVGFTSYPLNVAIDSTKMAERILPDRRINSLFCRDISYEPTTAHRLLSRIRQFATPKSRDPLPSHYNVYCQNHDLRTVEAEGHPPIFIINPTFEATGTTRVTYQDPSRWAAWVPPVTLVDGHCCAPSGLMDWQVGLETQRKLSVQSDTPQAQIARCLALTDGRLQFRHNATTLVMAVRHELRMVYQWGDWTIQISLLEWWDSLAHPVSGYLATMQSQTLAAVPDFTTYSVSLSHKQWAAVSEQHFTSELGNHVAYEPSGVVSKACLTELWARARFLGEIIREESEKVRAYAE